MVLGKLQHGVADLLAAGSDGFRRATDIEQAFGVDYKLAWQVFRIARSDHALAAGLHVPARVSMKKLLTAAARRRIDADVIARVSDAFESFESFLFRHADDRAQLDAMIRILLPEERQKHDLENRQDLFRATSQFKGTALECETGTNFCFPSSDGRGVSEVRTTACWGLRRLRPGSRIGFSTSNDVHPGAEFLSLDRRGTEQSPMSMLIPEFCTTPLPQLDAVKRGNIILYSVAGNDVGLRTGVDLVLADYQPHSFPLYREPTHERVGMFYIPEIPSKRTTLDYFVHKDVWPGITPRVIAYDILPHGPISKIGEASREHDRVEISEPLRSVSIASAALPHVRRYSEFLEYMLAKLGHSAADYRGYRLDLLYPSCGVQYIVVFDLPEAPGR